MGEGGLSFLHGQRFPCLSTGDEEGPSQSPGPPSLSRSVTVQGGPPTCQLEIVWELTARASFPSGSEGLPPCHHPVYTNSAELLLVPKPGRGVLGAGLQSNP